MPDNQIIDSRAREFVAALRAFEQSCDPAAITELFAPDATLTRPQRPRRARRPGRVLAGVPGAVPRAVSTTFSTIVEGVDACALEWSSTGTLTDDRPITYRGVTVLDLDGPKIVRLRTYYDTAAFTMTPAGTR